MDQWNNNPYGNNPYGVPSEAPSLKRALESAARDSELAKLTDRLYQTLRQLDDRSLQVFKSSLALLQRVVEEFGELDEDEDEAVLNLLRTRRANGVAVAKDGKKPKVEIVDPPYVVDPEPEET